MLGCSRSLTTLIILCIMGGKRAGWVGGTLQFSIGTNYCMDEKEWSGIVEGYKGTDNREIL